MGLARSVQKCEICKQIERSNIPIKNKSISRRNLKKYLKNTIVRTCQHKNKVGTPFKYPLTQIASGQAKADYYENIFSKKKYKPFFSIDRRMSSSLSLRKQIKCRHKNQKQDFKIIDIDTSIPQDRRLQDNQKMLRRLENQPSTKLRQV